MPICNGLPGIGGEPPLIHADAGALPAGARAIAAVSRSPTPTRASSACCGPQNEQPRVERLLPPETASALEATEPEPDAAQRPSTGWLDAAPAVDRTSIDPAGAAGTADDDRRCRTRRRRAAAAEPSPDATAEAGAAGAAGRRASRRPRSAPCRVRQPRRARRRHRRSRGPAAPWPSRPARPSAQPAARHHGVAAVQPQRGTATRPHRRHAARTARPAAPGAGPKPLVPRRAGHARPAQPSSAGAGVYRLQLTAVRSEAGLTKAWADLRDRYPRRAGLGEPAGRAYRDQLGAAVPPAGRAVHRPRGRGQRLRHDPRDRRPVLHRRADRAVRLA